MKINEKTKKILTGIFAVVIVVIVGISFLTNDLEHIEDTNGADNYELQKITDEDIIEMDMGALNLDVKEGAITKTTYSSKKYTGVSEIYSTNMVGNRLDITINHARVDSGNFKIVLLENDKIVHEFKLNELTQTYTLKNPSGYISLRIAGESADFQLDYSVM